MAEVSLFKITIRLMSLDFTDDKLTSVHLMA